ncbi:hypothetical protein POVWA1_044080 [Plasmodium ovale wallikeri]|uniref:Uncharacterized protein n=1 Tax=Plasmodium ovale wallikeri TaxID=864142 RepID=A0A1A8ZCA0_PLAOA|nr:hypothetical protein POVWA1_044080 [Plasmodium ovale wallikeri]
MEKQMCFLGCTCVHDTVHKFGIGVSTHHPIAPSSQTCAYANSSSSAYRSLSTYVHGFCGKCFYICMLREKQSKGGKRRVSHGHKGRKKAVEKERQMINTGKKKKKLLHLKLMKNVPKLLPLGEKLRRNGKEEREETTLIFSKMEKYNCVNGKSQKKKKIKNKKKR